MKKSHLMVPILATALMAGMWLTSVQAQDQNPAANENQARQQRDQQVGDNADQGRRGQRMSREDMQKRMAERMKTAMGASDEEWTVLEPAIQKVQTLQRESRGGGMMGRRGGPGGRGGPEGANAGADAAPRAPESAVAKASQDLRTTLENKDASADTIKTKLAALRSAKAKAHEELTKAQDELRGLLNARQEAQLVIIGMLD